ncbi:hypothetical protein JTE90_021488 [Oedothorax gibbosus]|uniref:LysR substrate-binding domain-containing protein n=1 Tax=Oedothorax gibbosus TaxID=931172 RepID=A0AAV6VQB9_9ARAC|nr:hypothetical protein JTE90_021488 [Oedothorax gibbosus]
MEDFIDSSEIYFIENDGGKPTFLSFGGASSHPDLLLTHPNLSPHINHSLLAPPGGTGHKILMTIIKKQTFSNDPRITRWNLKKADWAKYTSLTENLIVDLTLDDNDKALDQIVFGIEECALACIPRSHVKNADYLQAHLCRVGLADSPDCVFLRFRSYAW